MNLFRKNKDDEHKAGRFKQAFEAARPMLRLSPDQESKIMGIFNEFRSERKELKNSSREDATEAIRAARKETKQKIMAVLSEEQKSILQDHLHKYKEQND
jgi:hypothetical protein